MILYGVFALTTAIMTVWALRPVLLRIYKSTPLSPLSQNRITTYFTFFILALLLAPALFFVVLFPTMREDFLDSMEKQLSLG